MANDVAVGSFICMLKSVKHNRVKLCYADVILMFPLYELPGSEAHREVLDEAEFLECLAWCGWRLDTPLCDSMKVAPDSFSVIVERAEAATTPNLAGEVEWSLRTPPADGPHRLSEDNVLEIDIDYPSSGSVGWIYVTFGVDRVSHVVTSSEFFNCGLDIAELFFSFMNHASHDWIKIDEEGNYKDIILRPARAGYLRLIVKDHDYGGFDPNDMVRITYIDIEVDARRLVNICMTAVTEFLHKRHDVSRWREFNLYQYYVNTTWISWGRYLEKMEDRPVEEVMRIRAQMAERLKLISCGREGVERAALDVAMALDIDAGGWCMDEAEEDAIPVPKHYPVKPLKDSGLLGAWDRNIDESDATVFIYFSEIKYGSKLRADYCDKQNKPRVFLCADSLSTSTAATVLTQFVEQLDVRILNVIGPSEARQPGAYRYTRELLEKFLGHSPQLPAASE